MTTTLNTSRSENTMVLSARVSACMYFLVYIYNVYGFFSCYLDARTAFTLLCIGIKMDILNSATYSIVLITDNILSRSASANSPSIKLSHAEQYVA